MRNIKKLLNIIIISFVLVLSSCAESEEGLHHNKATQDCMPLEEVFDLEQNYKYEKIVIPDEITGQLHQKGIMEWITDRITVIIEDASKKIYEEISEDTEFRTILGILVTLTIMFYALSIMLGISQASGYAVMIFFLKVIIIYNFATNWDTLFYPYVVEVFEAFVNDTVRFAAGTFHDYGEFSGDNGAIPVPGNDPSMFSEIDKMISVLWDFRLAKIIIAFMFTGVTGFFWGAMLLMFMLLYLTAVIVAVKTYIFALLARHVLYALGPIFLSFALFNQTKSLFDGYIEQLINFSLQPVFLFIFLGLFHMVLAGFASELYLKNLTNTDKYFGGNAVAEGPKPCIKYKEFMNIRGTPLYRYQLCLEGGNDNCEGASDLNPAIPVDIWSLISAIIVCYLMYAMTGWVVQVATRLSSGYVNISDIPIEGFSRFQTSISDGAKGLMSQAMKPGGGGSAGGGAGGGAGASKPNTVRRNR